MVLKHRNCGLLVSVLFQFHIAMVPMAHLCHGFGYGLTIHLRQIQESVRIAMLFFFDWNRLFAYTFALGWTNET